MGSAFQASYKENQASCHELGFPTADHSPFCLLPGTHGPFHRRSLPHRGIGRPWHVVNHLAPVNHGHLCANLLPAHRKAWDGMRTSFTQLKLWGDFRQERGHYWKLSWNLTVTIILTSLIQCNGSLNDSWIWKLKPVNGKNPVTQDHNPVFSLEKQSCSP